MSEHDHSAPLKEELSQKVPPPASEGMSAEGGPPLDVPFHAEASRREPSPQTQGSESPRELVPLTPPVISSSEGFGQPPMESVTEGSQSPSESHETPTGEGKSDLNSEGKEPGAERPRRRILIGSQRDPAQYRPKPVGEGFRLVGFRRRHPRKDRSRERSGREVLPEERAQEEEKNKPKVHSPKIGDIVSPTDDIRSPHVEDVSVATPLRSEGSPPPAPRDQVASQPEDSSLTPAPVAPPLAAGADSFGEITKPSSVPPTDVASPTGTRDSSSPEYVSEAGLVSPTESLVWDAISETLPSLARLPALGSDLASKPGEGFPPPKPLGKLPAELESELEAALAGFSMDEALQTASTLPRERLPEDSLVDARVVALHEDKVFVDLGVREQGVLSLKETDQPPEVGSCLQVRIVRFDSENSVYEVALPAQAADIAAWEQLAVGTLVEARVTGVNAGGLECEVGHIRGFIPMSQIALFRVSHPEEYLGQRLTCVVLEANREKRNLVLSRRAALEREQEAAREALWAKLEPGQVYDGLVRKLMDFGAFVDIGGVDGLLHISQISWGRINHPSEVLQEGQRIKVKILAVDQATRRISLAYRDLAGDPWQTVEAKYPPNSVVHGRVTRLMPYGAFVELEPGVEGLIHISELAWKKVWRVSDVLQAGQEVDAVVLSVDSQARRISLSMKHLSAPPEETNQGKDKAEEPSPNVELTTVGQSPGKRGQESAASVETAETSPESKGSPEPEPPRPQEKKKSKSDRPLRGGLGRSPSGNPFGLRW